MRIFLLSLFLLFSFSLQAAPVAQAQYAKVSLVSEADAITPGNPFHVAIDFELTDGWHIYWKNPGDSGLAASTFWDIPAGFSVGSIQWPAPHRFEMEGLMNYGYEGSPSLIQKIVPPQGLEGEAYSVEGNEVILKAELEWLVCKEICIPESAEVSLTLPVSDKVLIDTQRFNSRFAALPTELEKTVYYEEKPDAIYLQLPTSVKKEAYFYPEIDGIIEHALPQELLQGEGHLVLKLPKGSASFEGELAGVLAAGECNFAVQAQAGTVIVLEKTASKEGSLSLGVALLFALLGGLLLNAMPCVFPVLSLKALSISQKAQGELSQVRKQGIAYLVGVVASFLALGGVMILLKSSGHSLGWGFQLQSPTFVTAMLLLFFVLGLSLVGMFHLPVLMGNAAHEAGQKESTKGSFLTGVLAVLVATPCAVPFMAPAVGYAFSQTAAVTLLIMVFLAVGLALPYVLLAWFPALHRALPKPGAWMNRFKEAMAFPMFASAAWLVWVLAQQTSLDVIALVLFGLVGISFFIWLKGKWGAVLASLLSAALLFGVYEAGNKQTVDAYKALSQPFSLQKLDQYRAEGKAVFVNATAAWCITCKVNERVALRDVAIADAFAAQDITYLVADWTNRDEEITQWLERYDRSGVPLYVYYPPNGGDAVILPQLLTPTIVIDSLKEK